MIGGLVDSCYRDKVGCLYSFCVILLFKSLTAVVIIIINLLLSYWRGGGAREKVNGWRSASLTILTQHVDRLERTDTFTFLTKRLLYHVP